jgi:hypothetical protein
MEHQTGEPEPGLKVELERPPESAAVIDEPAAAAAEPAPIAGESALGEPAGATGEPRVDAALRLLERLPGLPVSEHPELFEQVHAQLSDVLSELDSGPAGPAGG